jgi:hypothetical protein
METTLQRSKTSLMVLILQQCAGAEESFLDISAAQTYISV